MSATKGTLASRAMVRNAAVDSTSGQETRTMSAPASSNWRISFSVAAASASVSAATRAATRIEELTEREREVLTLVAQGMTNGEIASSLYLAEATVKTHIGHILAKLTVRDRVGLVVLAYDAGLVSPQA